MDIRCGLDLVEIERIERTLSKGGESFKDRVFTVTEKAFCEKRGKASAQSYAARFCAKEAVVKALGTGISGGISFLDIEVVNDGMGKPRVNLYNAALRKFESIGGKAIDISLTHTKNYAAAQVVILL